MKRDPELIRQILIQIEENSTGGECPELQIDGYDVMMIHYHCWLLIDDGYVKGAVAELSSGVWCEPRTLTNKGHDLLDLIKNDTLWNKFKELSKEHGLKVIFQVLTTNASKVLGLSD